jgi:hypothetical protein
MVGCMVLTDADRTQRMARRWFREADNGSLTVTSSEGFDGRSILPPPAFIFFGGRGE